MKRTGFHWSCAQVSFFVCLGWLIIPGSVSAAAVTALNITGGTLQVLNTTGSSALLTYALTPGASGRLVTGTYQAAGEIVSDISLLGPGGEVQEMRFYTAASGGLFPGPYPAPAGYTIDGNTLVMDMRAWFADIVTLPDGSLATVNQGPKNLIFGHVAANAFSLTWDAVPYLTIGSITGPTRWTLSGTVEVSAVPLPAASWLFGAGFLHLLVSAARDRPRCQ